MGADGSAEATEAVAPPPIEVEDAAPLNRPVTPQRVILVVEDSATTRKVIAITLPRGRHPRFPDQNLAVRNRQRPGPELIDERNGRRL